MLNLQVKDEQADFNIGWELSDGAWRRGSSFIKPYQHRVIEAFAVRCNNRTAFVIRESPQQKAASHLSEIQDVSPSRYSDAISSALAWDLNVQLVQIDDDERTVEIRSGSWGTAPLYAVVLDGTLRANWDAAELYPYMVNGVNLPRTVYSAVHIGYHYSRFTLFQDLIHLTERSTARWKAGSKEISFEYPAPVPRIRPKQVREGADIPGAFGTLLERAVSQWVSPELPVGTQLSGGVDSSAVAVALATISDRPVRTYGLIMPGTNGVFQAARRRELVERFRFIDVTIPGMSHKPFSGASDHYSGADLIPWSEFYYDSGRALGELARQDDLDVLFTGLGGDELSTMTRNEPHDSPEEDDFELPPFLTERGLEAYVEASRTLELAPRPAVETSSIESAATNADLFLRNGLWPGYPYCTPWLVDFARSLPPEWRRNRDFQREYLKQSGCSDEVARPKVTETFSDIMSAALLDEDGVIRPVFEESVLASEGLIDRDILLRLYDELRQTGSSPFKDVFVELAVLELTIRSVERASHHKSIAL